MRGRSLPQVAAFVYQPDAVTLRRLELAKFFANLDGSKRVQARTLMQHMERMGLRLYEHTVSRLAKDRPIFDVYAL